ncbi:hypothetical protein ACFUCT_25030 [Streptomyces parvus]|uniref:hypothetical protein n=1 Tax=Streptomyces parvus TaxID=66428 RepID=UPI003640B018
MSTTPDQHIAELRAAVASAARHLAFAAGLEAAADPEHSQTLLSEAAHLEQVLARTSPESTGA